MPSKEAIVLHFFPANTFTYLLSPKDLLESNNAYIFNEGKAQNKFNHENRLVIANKDPEQSNKHLSQLQKDLPRGLSIEGDSPRHLSNFALRVLLQEKVGNEHAKFIFAHYSQKQAYFLTRPLKCFHQEDMQDPDLISIRKDPDYTENIFKYADSTLRDSSSSYFTIYVPEDREFILDAKRAEFLAEDKQIKETAEEKAETKKHRINNFGGFWNFKMELKILSLATPDGFEFLGIGTDSALVSNMFRNVGDPKKQLNDLVTTVVEIEKDALKKQFELLKQRAESTKLNQEKIDDEVVTLNVALESIKAFKHGQITFDKLIEEINATNEALKHGKKSLAGTTEVTQAIIDNFNRVTVGVTELFKPVSMPSTLKLFASFCEKLEKIKQSIDIHAAVSKNNPVALTARENRM